MSRSGWIGISLFLLWTAVLGAEEEMAPYEAWLEERGLRLGFASAERLMRYLGVIPGAVTPLAALNDHSGAVTVVLDAAVLKDALINVHPLHNAATTALSPGDLVTFLEAVGHAPEIIDMTAMTVPG